MQTRSERSGGGRKPPVRARHAGPRKFRRREVIQRFLLTLPLPAIVNSLSCARQQQPVYASRIRLFYRPEMVLQHDTARNYSKSPLKPRLFVNFLRRQALLKYFDMRSDWTPFRRDDFLVAHTERYVDAFFSGREPLVSSNRLTWSEQFADSVRYTNASLYHALVAAVTQPAHIAFSPTSGFHHATPRAGSGFCTFSGQVIASVKLYRQYQLSGAYIDLDGHYGNSIDDSRTFVPELNEAVPRGCNVNPKGKHGAYLADLTGKLRWLRGLLLKQRIHYIVFAHGADSHEWDDLGGQCTTAEWLEASRRVYGMIDDTSRALGRPVPLVMSLFGGYRRDHYDSVLSLHAADAAICLSLLCHHAVAYQPEVQRPPSLSGRLPQFLASKRTSRLLT